MRPSVVWSALGVLSLLGFPSCTSSTSLTASNPVQTSLIVDPVDFLNGAICGTGSGAMQSYQATLFDVTAGLKDAFELASSDVLPCTSAAYFEFVGPGRRYIAKIQGFARNDVRPQRTGVRLVVDEEGKRVEPDYVTTCWGEDGVDYTSAWGGAGGASTELGAQAYEESRIYVRGCEPFDAGGAAPPTGVSIRPHVWLTEFQCGDEPGQISRFLVRPIEEEPESPPEPIGGASGAGGAATEGPDEDPRATAPLEVACGATAEFLDLEAGVDYDFEIEAWGANAAEPTLVTECHARTEQGTVTSATCEPFELVKPPLEN